MSERVFVSGMETVKQRDGRKWLQQQCNGMALWALSTRSSKLGRPPYVQQQVCVICRKCRSACTIAAAVMIRYSARLLAVCRGLHLVRLEWMLGLAGMSMQWRVLRNSKGDRRREPLVGERYSNNQCSEGVLW